MDHYPDPLFHWALPEAPPPLTNVHPLRPHPKSLLMTRTSWVASLLTPSCAPAPSPPLPTPILLAPDTSNLVPGLRLAPGYHDALSYYDLSGRSHTSSVPEVAHWICTLPPHPVPVTPAPVAASAVPTENVPSEFRASNSIKVTIVPPSQHCLRSLPRNQSRMHQSANETYSVSDPCSKET